MLAANAVGSAGIGIGTNYLAQVSINNTATPPALFPINAYNPQLTSPVTIAPGTISPAGSSAPHENRGPYLTMNVCIATTGIFPSRN